MLRSSSMLITRARSVRNAGKTSFKFSFDLIIESVDKLAATGPVVLIWERTAAKILTTKTCNVDRNTRKVDFQNEVLSSNLSLFKNSHSDKTFLEKVVKLAVKANNAEGKTLGKIHLNLADYAEVPSGSKKISAELSNGAVLIATVQCAFTSLGKREKGGSDSGGGGVGEEDDDSTGNDDDLVSTMDGGSARSLSVHSDENSSGSLKGKLKLGAMGSKMGIGYRKSREIRHNGGGGGDEGGGEEVVRGVDKLKKENAKLRKQLEEAERALGREAMLMNENKMLKREVEELKVALSREPEFGDVVAQLKETKMALAILQLEKDQLSLQVQTGSRA